MADKDLHWIRDWDIISAAADGLFIHSHYLQSTGAVTRDKDFCTTLQPPRNTTALTQIHTFTWQNSK